jgi:L,D-transpeptidase catalytic domain
MVHSYKYANAPMPNSIFFYGQFAIHGSNAVGALGRPASHGCIRLAPRNAAKLFALVKAQGAQIRIVGSLDVRIARTRSRSNYASSYAPIGRPVALRQWARDPFRR